MKKLEAIVKEEVVQSVDTKAEGKRKKLSLNIARGMRNEWSAIYPDSDSGFIGVYRIGVFDKTVEGEMKISEVIESLKRELEQYGDVEVERWYDDHGYNDYSPVYGVRYDTDRNTVVCT